MTAELFAGFRLSDSLDPFGIGAGLWGQSRAGGCWYRLNTDQAVITEQLPFHPEAAFIIGRPNDFFENVFQTALASLKSDGFWHGVEGTEREFSLILAGGWFKQQGSLYMPTVGLVKAATPLPC